MSMLRPGLRGQLVVIVTLALLVAQGVSVWFLVDERGMAVQAAQGQETADRAANVVRLIETGPDMLQSEILDAATSSLVRFTIGSTPIVTHGGHDAGGTIAARIHAMLGGDTGREVLVEIHEIAAAMPFMDQNDAEMMSMHREMMAGNVSGIEMGLAIGLTDGRWLNVETRFLRPPIQWPLMSVAGFGLLAALLLGGALWVGLSQVTGPLRNLAMAADRFGRGDEPVPLRPRGPAEIRDLTGAFLRMQDRLSRFVADRTRLLASLGHDLRSPLTALRVRAELVEEDETRDSLITSIEEMQDMVETTLAYAKGISGSEAMETVVAHDFLAALVGDADPPVPVRIDAAHRLDLRPVSMRRALRNLIENATRYGGSVEIDGELSGEVLVISISDRGPGIAEDDLERVFDPYVRLEESRSRDTGGIGLGLSIARSIIRAHGGDLRLANRTGGGLIARVELPLSNG